MKQAILFILFISIASLGFSATNRVYMNLPNDKMDTEGMIQKQVMLKRLPIDAKEKDNKNLKLENDIVKNFTMYLRDLDEKTRSLYNQTSPFGEMLGSSSDPMKLETSVSRKAKKDEYQIKIIQTAKADSFYSDSLSRSTVLAPADFTIQYGMESIRVQFAGGTLSALQKTIADQARDRLDVKLINDTTSTSILAISAKKTGETNRLRFSGDLKTLMGMNLLYNADEKKTENAVDFSLAMTLNTNKLKLAKDWMALEPFTEGYLDLSSQNIKIGDNTVFLYTAGISPAALLTNALVVINTNFLTNFITNISNVVYTNVNTNLESVVTIQSNNYKEFELLKMEAVKISNIKIEGGSLITFFKDATSITNALTNLTAREMNEQATNIIAAILTNLITNEIKPTIVPNSNFSDILTVIFNDGIEKHIDVPATGAYSNFLGLYKGKTVVGIKFRNLNTDRAINLSNLAFDTKESEGGIQPKNYVTKANDALFTLDGVEIRRDKNDVDDVLDGVTIRLKEETSIPVAMKIDYNYPKVSESISNWVESYNKTMTLLYILTKPEKNPLPLADREEDKIRDGVFQTEYSFINLRNALRTVAMEAYKTRYEKEIALLEQIGVYTKKTGKIDRQSDAYETMLMGLLNIDNEKLKDALYTKYDGVAELFGNDTDGDYIKDSGLAVTINKNLQIPLSAAGFLTKRIQLNDDKMKNNTEAIADLNKAAEDFEQQLRRKYGNMNSAINESEARRKWLEGQFK